MSDVHSTHTTHLVGYCGHGPVGWPNEKSTRLPFWEIGESEDRIHSLVRVHSLVESNQ